jgi:uncharacterized repeat protein (TIGR04138 family)
MSEERRHYEMVGLAQKTGRSVEAYFLVLDVIDYLIVRYYGGKPKHLTPRQLSLGLAAYAVENFGLLAHATLSFCGINDSTDLGEVVGELIEANALTSKEGEQPSDFNGIIGYREEDFQRKYEEVLALVHPPS